MSLTTVTHIREIKYAEQCFAMQAARSNICTVRISAHECIQPAYQDVSCLQEGSIDGNKAGDSGSNYVKLQYLPKSSPSCSDYHVAVSLHFHNTQFVGHREGEAVSLGIV